MGSVLLQGVVSPRLGVAARCPAPDLPGLVCGMWTLATDPIPRLGFGAGIPAPFSSVPEAAHAAAAWASARALCESAAGGARPRGGGEGPPGIRTPGASLPGLSLRVIAQVCVFPASRTAGWMLWGPVAVCSCLEPVTGVAELLASQLGIKLGMLIDLEWVDGVLCRAGLMGGGQLPISLKGLLWRVCVGSQLPEPNLSLPSLLRHRGAK